MSRLAPYQIVRVRELLFPNNTYDGWKLNKRAPEVGDVGVVVDVHDVIGEDLRYLVECCEADGTTIFLSEFDAVEIEPMASGNVEPDPTEVAQ